MKKKQGRRVLYGLVGVVMAATAIGGVAAKESKPYDAPELRLAKGMDDYNLLEGITYNEDKYELEVADEGQFDIDVLGKYEVEYALIPVDPEETAAGTTGGAVSGTAGGVGGGVGTGSAAGAGSVTESTAAEESSEAETSAGESDTTGTDGAAENTGAAESAEAAETTGAATENEKVETSGAADENPTEAETSETKESDSSHETDGSEAGGSGTKESESADQDSSGNENAGTAEDAKMETEGDVKSETEGNAKSEAKDDAKPEVEDSKTSAKADNIFSGLLKRLTGYVYAAETKDEEAGLDETEKVIRFTRDVRVVTSLDAPNIEYDAPLLQIPADADLYELVINKEMQVATPSQAEKKATPDRPEKKEMEQLATDMQLEREPDREENDGVEVEFDGMTEEGVEYNLVLKNPGLILEDAVLADETGKKIKKAKVSISNDSDLKTAVEVIDGLDGVPMILGLREGRYEVTLSAIEPKSGEEIQCVREIEVISGEHIRFQAPTLYIGTHNSSYNLTDGMYAVDENGDEVTALYVIDDSELLAARIGAKATPANAESQMDDGSLENGEEQGDEEVREDGEAQKDGETQEELAEGTELKKGTYHVVLGAKHPISGEEFTVIREVQVIDGYYIYAPDLEIEAGSTDYNLLEGAEVRDASENGVKVDAPMEVTDISDLLRGAEDESEGVETESTASEDTGLTEDEVISGSVNIDNGETLMTAFSLETDGENADGVSGIKTAGEADTETIPDSESHPAVKKGIYRVTLSTVDAQTGETRTVVRTVRAVRTQFPMTATFTAYASNISEGITALFEANNMDSQMRAGVGGVDLHLGSGFTLQKMQERMENRAYTLDSVGADSPLLGQKIIAPGYDASVVMEKYDDWTGQLLVGEKTVKVFEAIKTFRYRVQNDTLAKMLGYAGQWYQSYGYKATGFPTGHDVNQNYIFWYTGSMGPSLCEKYMTKVDTSQNRQFTIENATQNNKVFDVNPVLGSKPYVGYMATKHYIDAAGNNGGWNWNIPEHENFGYHLVTTGYWKNVGYYEKGRATWEEDDTSGRDLYKAGDKKTFKNGWFPDVTVTANAGQVEDLTAKMLNVEELYKNSNLAANGISLESSILVDGKGKTLEIQNVANGNARKSILVPNMQLGFRNFSNMAADFTIAKDAYLRLEDIHGTNNDPRYIFDVGSLDPGKQALNNGSTLEIVGPAAAGDMKAFNVWNIQNVIVRAGEADMSPVRVVNKTTEAAAFDQLIDTNGKTVTFYQSFNQAPNGKATTTLTGGGTIDFAQTRSLDYAGDTAEPEIGNLMTTGQLVLKGDVSLSKSSYTNPKGAGGADIKNYTALKINGGKRTDNNHGKFRSNGYRITAVAGSHGHGDFVEGEIFAGQGAGSDMESTAILDPTDFVLGAPQEGTPTADGKYLYLTSKNDSKIIFVTALDHKAISVDPGIGGEKISWYNTYDEALTAISGQGIKGTDYIVTNYIEREFSENASDLLEDLSIENAASVTFTSASRDAVGLQPNLGAGDRFLVRMRRGIFKAPQEVKVVFRNMALRYDQGDNNDPKLGTDANMVFTADGGDLVIDDDCVFLGAVKTYKKQNGDTATFDTWSNMLPTVYAGAVSGDSNKTSSVTIKSGFYQGVYGGNMREPSVDPVLLPLSRQMRTGSSSYQYRL